MNLSKPIALSILSSILFVFIGCRTSSESSTLNREGAGVGNTAGYGRGWPQFGWFLTTSKGLTRNSVINVCVIGDNNTPYIKPILDAAKPWVQAVKNLKLNSTLDPYHFVTDIKYVKSCSEANLTVHLNKIPEGISIAEGTDIASIKKNPIVNNLMAGGDIYLSKEYLSLPDKKFHRAMLQSWGHVFGTREISGTVMGKEFLNGGQPGAKVEDLTKLDEVKEARLKGEKSCRKTKYMELFARPKGYCLYYGSAREIDDFDGDQ